MKWIPCRNVSIVLIKQQKYNVSYTVDKDEKEKFIGYIVKDGTQTDLLAMCKKDGDYYSAMFQIPDEK